LVNYNFIFLVSFFLLAVLHPTNSHGFDYERYASKTSRTLEPINSKSTSFKKKNRSISTSSFAKKFLEKLDSDVIPTSFFEDKKYSVYMKLSKISKVGVKYKF
jgi:hypothetical protein